jgi:iron complex outermembrane receptor protein
MNSTLRRRLMMGAAAALAACSGAGVALGQDASQADPSAAATPSAGPQTPATPPPSTTSAGAEGASVGQVIVTAERQVGARAAPTKASLDETQPESIISHDFIESVTPDVGNISTVVFIAPSISGISANAGGIGNYFSTTLRGFTDGEYNVTYDGISFGDTNNPTHHPNDYFPVSEIGAAVVDRGPGAAGDLGQANYGGAIHYFSPDLSDQPGLLQKITYGSFNTFDSVTTLQTGDIRQLGGGKLWTNFDERSSDTELSDSSGYAYNQAAKFVLPADGDKLLFTAYVTHAWSRYNFPDSNGPGETLQQVAAYGKDFQLTDIPNEEHYTGYNYERKQTWFTYLDLKYQLAEPFSIEDQPYYYFYDNKTESSADNSGLIGVNTKPINGNDIEGYLKVNDYEVYGDVLRFAYKLPFGVLKVGGLIEGSDTYRQKAYYDLTRDAPYDLYVPGAKQPLLTAPTNCKTCEDSSWVQEQGFVDFNWTPLHNLTISPGFKYVNFTRRINAAEDTLTVNGASVIGPIVGRENFSSPLYFMTANYKLTHSLAVYGQYATSFLIPQLSELQVPGVSLQNLKPETTTNYQTGVVFSRGPATMDADLYMVKAANTNVACNIFDTATGTYDAASCNAGKVTYSGFEGEGAYLLPIGLTLFVNGSINNARQAAQAPNTTTGITGNPGQELAGVPNFTAALGAIYHRGPWQASMTYKSVGGEFVTGAVKTAANPGGQLEIPSYSTVNGDVAYTFLGHYQLKLQVFNLFDRRTLTNYVPSGNETALYQSNGGFYTYQSGREIDGTVSVKF